MTRKPTSTIARNPEIRALVDDLLESNATYQQIIQAVHDATSVLLTDSALSRYRQQWVQRKQLEAGKEAEVEALLRTFQGGGTSASLDEAARGLLKKKLVQRLADADATFDEADLLEVGHLMIKSLRLEQLQLQIQTQRERLELLRKKAELAGAEIAQIGRAKNLDEATIREIQEKVYGIVPAAA